MLSKKKIAIAISTSNKEVQALKARLLSFQDSVQLKSKQIAQLEGSLISIEERCKISHTHNSLAHTKCKNVQAFAFSKLKKTIASRFDLR